MFRSFYEPEKRNKTIYDRVREYCLAENINEEQLRASIKKEESANKRIKICRITGGLSVLFAASVRIIHSVRQSMKSTTTVHPVKRITKK